MRSSVLTCLSLGMLTSFVAGCGRSDLLGFDNGGCPPDDPYCVAPGEGGLRRDAGRGSDGPIDIDASTDDGPFIAGDGPNTLDLTVTGEGGSGRDGGDRDGPIVTGDGGTGNGDGGRGDGGIFDGPMTSDGGGLGGDGGPGLDGPATVDLLNVDGARSDLARTDGGPAPDMRPPCIPTGPEVCNDFIDNDCNGFTDCRDRACAPLKVCINHQTEVCDDSDNDGDPGVECKEPECFGDAVCFVRGREICNNGIDDNDNGLVDCADPECFNNPVCMPHMGVEICNNGIDDNGDGLIDCVDPQCATFPACIQFSCTAEIDFGTVAQHGARVARSFNTVGAVRRFNTCASPGGTARVGLFQLTATTDVKLDASQGSGEAHVVEVFRAGTLQACDANPVYCLQLGQMASATHTLSGLVAGSYFVVVQSFTGTQGPVTVTLSTGTGKSEICGNGVDDDGNGLTDCQDQACINDPTCTNLECKPDTNVGALVVNDTNPPKEVKLDTRMGANRWHPTCAGTSTGNDYVIRFTLPQPAGILVQWTQTDGSVTGDHVLTLFNTPPPGLGCDAFQTSCYDPGGGSGGSVAFQNRPQGDYLLILKAKSVSGESFMDIKISAFAGRTVEICNNGIDDDGNGLTDCNDPACFGVGNCRAPQCLPDVDLGDFVWGTVKSTVVDTTSGNTLYQSKCAQGSGKEKVIRVSLDQPMALGFSCTETGDNVLQLTQQVNPLDLCDQNKLVCGDPKTLPFGCNYAVPNLQPGKYNVIVQAFAAGTEGTVNLTLFGIQENAAEICDNGIDDDKDGFTDCADKKCVTSPLCAKFSCRADDKLGLLPLDGSTTSTVVRTSNSADNNTLTPCVTSPGGKDAVIDFQMPSQGDLKIDWAQVGDHDFALYEDASDLLACEANPLVDCHSSKGAATGSYTLVKLPGKRYHLVVDADKPGKEGGVVVQFSGFPNP